MTGIIPRNPDERPDKPIHKLPKKPHKRRSKAKTLMLQELTKRLGNVTLACKAIGICRATHYQWLQKDAEYREKVEEIPEIELDFLEQALRNRIDKGDTTAIIFALKCKGKKRGYVERQELETEIRFSERSRQAMSEAYEEHLKKEAQDGSKDLTTDNKE